MSLIARERNRDGCIEILKTVNTYTKKRCKGKHKETKRQGKRIKEEYASRTENKKPMKLVTVNYRDARAHEQAGRRKKTVPVDPFFHLKLHIKLQNKTTFRSWH